MLKGKNVLLGISASIAAYKSAIICRLLIKEGAKVKVLMTPDSVNFISPLTLSTLSKNPVYSQYFDPNSGEWSNHVELAKWADFFVLAPATANTIAKMANGICDNLLLATYFSMENPVYFAPAMDLDMFKHPANQNNLERLISYGNQMIPAESGELASGLFGEGRMAEPENIISFLGQDGSFWQGKKVLITAGPTYEAIDPVRFIGNHSSGKMGISLANEFIKRGAKVTLIHGPITIQLPSNSTNISVVSAQEMFDSCKLEYEKSDVIIMAAAVADYTVVNKASEKIKKSDSSLNLKLESTKDILMYLGKNKTENQFLVGFALETNDEINHAKSKLKRKNLDLIILNSLRDKGAGFATDTNKIVILDKNNNQEEYELKSKHAVAVDIINSIEMNLI
jgi:phosphopantothenoylcysteine decarboxylase/phosphopantothenate--cysteine ligase